MYKIKYKENTCKKKLTDTKKIVIINASRENFVHKLHV